MICIKKPGLLRIKQNETITIHGLTGGVGGNMSGGHWDYEDSRIVELLEKISNDGYVIKRFPALTVVLRTIGKTLGDIAHDLDWDLSGDSMIENDQQFEIESIKKLGQCLKLKLKIKTYEIEEEKK